VTRLVLLATSSRVDPRLLSADAWSAIQSGPVLVADSESSTARALAGAGATIHAVDRDSSTREIALALLDAARLTGTSTWLLRPGDDDALANTLGTLVARGVESGSVSADEIEIESLVGSWDLPGARLLDVVSTMDRLRSPGGCPWDAEQDHETLAPYLLEEAYEAFQAIEDGNLDGLREELGDVLLQVVFHARLAQELAADSRWSVDDVASGLVDKLHRRHPHVFGETAVRDAREVNSNWETIKAAERGGRSALADVPLSAPALTLAATLQRKAERSGAVWPSRSGPTDLRAAMEEFQQVPTGETAGELLWRLVAAMRAHDVDAESSLRARARSFRDAVVPADAGAEDRERTLDGRQS
jgi:XTP/dITP diphosphohydrolase